MPHVPRAQRPAPGSLPAAIEAHLGSRDVARTIYGAVVGLALIVALQDHPPPPARMAATLVATAVAIGLAELYSEAVSLEARTRAPVGRRELRAIAAESVAVVAGGAFPAIFFIGAAGGLFDNDLAFTLSKWSGLGLICSYGFLAARLAGETVLRGLAHAAALGIVAAGLIALKALLH